MKTYLCSLSIFVFSHLKIVQITGNFNSSSSKIRRIYYMRPSQIKLSPERWPVLLMKQLLRLLLNGNKICNLLVKASLKGHN
jgi:hypothetical protein